MRGDLDSRIKLHLLTGITTGEGTGAIEGRWASDPGVSWSKARRRRIAGHLVVVAALRLIGGCCLVSARVTRPEVVSLAALGSGSRDKQAWGGGKRPLAL